MKNHIIDITIAAESLLAIRTATTAIATEFAAFTISLDDSQRKHSQHMGLRNETFSRDVLDLARERPQLVPPTIEVTALERDLTARQQLAPILVQLENLTKLAQDTHAALGIDVYNGARALYATMKVTAKVNGIADIISRIGERFKAHGQRSTAPDPVTAPTASNSTTTTTQN